MEQKSKLIVVQAGNPRGNNISVEEIKQCLLDIESWISKNAKDIYTTMKKNKVANDDDIKKLSGNIKDKLPLSLETLLKTSLPSMLIRDLYKTLSVNQIIDAIEVLQVNGYWKKAYIPFAMDEDQNYLCLENNKGNDVKVVSWCADMGVIEDISNGLGNLLEKTRDGLLKKKLQYIEGAGLVEASG